MKSILKNVKHLSASLVDARKLRGTRKNIETTLGLLASFFTSQEIYVYVGYVGILELAVGLDSQLDVILRM